MMGVDEDWYLKREGFDEEHHLNALIKNKEKLIIGRTPCQIVDIVCDSKTVSRKHCELFFKDGQWEVYAFKENKTFINKSPVPPEVPKKLLSNDKLGIGALTFHDMKSSKRSDYVFRLYKTVREASENSSFQVTSDATICSLSTERAVYSQTGTSSIFVHPKLLKDPKLSMRSIVSLSRCSVEKPKRKESRKSSSKKKQPSSLNPPTETNKNESSETINGPMLWIPMDELKQFNNTTPSSTTSTLPKQTSVESLQDEVAQPVTVNPIPSVKKENKGKSHLLSNSSDQPGPSNRPNVPAKMNHQPAVFIDIADSDSESEKENSAKQKSERKVFIFEKYSNGEVVVPPQDPTNKATQNDHPVVQSFPVTPPCKRPAQNDHPVVQGSPASPPCKRAAQINHPVVQSSPSSPPCQRAARIDDPVVQSSSASPLCKKATQNHHPVVQSSPATPPPSRVNFEEPCQPDSPPRPLVTANSPAEQNDQESTQSSSDDETPEERLQRVRRRIKRQERDQKTTKLTEAKCFSRGYGNPRFPSDSGPNRVGIQNGTHGEHEPERGRRRRISSEKKPGGIEARRDKMKTQYHLEGRPRAAKAPPPNKAKADVVACSVAVASLPHPTKNNCSSVPQASSSHFAKQPPATIVSMSNHSATVPQKSSVKVKVKVTSNSRANQLLNSMKVSDNTQTNKPAATLAQKRPLEGDESSRSSAAPPMKKKMIESENNSRNGVSKEILPKANFRAPSPTKKLPPQNIQPDSRRTSAETRPLTSSTNGPVPARIGNSTDSRRASTDTRPLTSSTNGPAPAKIGNGINAKRASTETQPQTLATQVSGSTDLITSVLGYSLNPTTSPHLPLPIIPVVQQEKMRNNGSTDPTKFARSSNKSAGFSRQP